MEEFKPTFLNKYFKVYMINQQERPFTKTFGQFASREVKSLISETLFGQLWVSPSHGPTLRSPSRQN